MQTTYGVNVAILSTYSACDESFSGHLGDLEAEKRGFPALGKRFRNLLEPCGFFFKSLFGFFSPKIVVGTSKAGI
jgi:hypothetical protein